MSNDLSLSLSAHQQVLPSGHTSTPATTAHVEQGSQQRLGVNGRTDGKAFSSSESPAVDGQELSSTVEHLNNLVKNIRHELRFSVDDTTGRTVINVRDVETDEVIRQIPPQQALELAAYFADFQSGLVREQV
jgi:flagellar protein FlaG